MMTAMQPYTPLNQAELVLRQNLIAFKRWDRSFTVHLRSKLPLPYPIEYTVGIIPEGENLLGVVSFGLPISRESLDELAEMLDELYVDFSVEADPYIRSLVFEDPMDPEKLNHELVTLREVCDQLYPLVMKIRRDRRWSQGLVRLALAPQEIFSRA